MTAAEFSRMLTCPPHFLWWRIKQLARWELSLVNAFSPWHALAYHPMCPVLSQGHASTLATIGISHQRAVIAPAHALIVIYDITLLHSLIMTRHGNAIGNAATWERAPPQ